MNSAQERRQALILRTTFAFCAAFVLITATSYGRVNVSKIISEPARALSHKTSGLSIPPAYAQEEQCLNPAGVAVGLKGLQNIRPKNAFVGTIFERRGNECPCSFVSFSSSLPWRFWKVSSRKILSSSLPHIRTIHQSLGRPNLSVKSMIPSTEIANAAPSWSMERLQQLMVTLMSPSSTPWSYATIMMLTTISTSSHHHLRWSFSIASLTLVASRSFCSTSRTMNKFLILESVERKLGRQLSAPDVQSITWNRFFKVLRQNLVPAKDTATHTLSIRLISSMIMGSEHARWM